jgi:hypothetical protein
MAVNKFTNILNIGTAVSYYRKYETSQVKLKTIHYTELKNGSVVWPQIYDLHQDFKITGNDLINNLQP